MLLFFVQVTDDLIDVVDDVIFDEVALECFFGSAIAAYVAISIAAECGKVSDCSSIAADAYFSHWVVLFVDILRICSLCRGICY